MKIRELKKLIDNLPEEKLDSEVYISDPDNSGIIGQLYGCRMIEVKTEGQFAWDKHENCNFPIGYSFLKLD